jgi:hypothetical protein
MEDYRREFLSFTRLNTIRKVSNNKDKDKLLSEINLRQISGFNDQNGKEATNVIFNLCNF